jgi:glycosyltransferase involved in cell wall biosynthesis
MSASDRISDLVRTELLGRLLERLGSEPQSRPGPREAERPGGAGSESEKPYSVTLQVVFCQYDRSKYKGSLERLVGLLSGMGVDYAVLVVDNGRPGDWSHAVSDRLVHVGGDNTEWEFSAFDRGLSYLERIGARAPVYALVTDAFLAYGDAFLAHIDGTVVNVVQRRGAVAGWVDAWPAEATLMGARYRDWVRTSFVFMPSDVVSALRPLAASIEPHKIFSADPDRPFLPDAPVGEELRRFLLEWLVGTEEQPLLAESWHSRFRLDEGSFPLFKKKAAAILREHLLSVRLRDAGIPCFDFRLFGRLRDGGVLWDDLDSLTTTRFEWSSWNAPDEDSVLKPLRYHIDRKELPAPTQHGDPAHFYLEGWLLAVPQPEVVKLHVGSRTLVGLRNHARKDVSKVFSGYAVTNPGFVVKGTLRGLPPGVHDVTLDFGGDRTVPLGRVDVVPLFELTVRRAIVPTSWPAGRPVPFAIEGEVRSSYRVLGVDVLIDGMRIDAPVFLGEGALTDQGVWSHDLAIGGQAEALSPLEQHTLEVRFRRESGSEESWTLPFTVSTTDVPCALRNIVIGPYDPDTGLTNVVLEVDVYEVEPGDRVVLERNGVEVLETVLRSGLVREANGTRRALIAVERQVAGIPAGVGAFALVLRRGHQRSLVWKGSFHVRYHHPEIHLEHLEVTRVRAEESPTYRIHVRGWVKNHFLVDCLMIEVDSSRASVIGMHELRPDVAAALGSPLVGRQGFDSTTDVTEVTPGEHVIHVIATQEGGERARVSRRVMFEDLPARRVSIVSEDLERLMRGQRTNFYSSITVRGALTIHGGEAVASLLVDDHLADEQPFDGPGRHEFSLRAVPPSSGEYTVRFVVSSRGRLVYETAPMRVSFRRVEFSPSLSDDLGVLLDRLDLRSKIVGHTTDRELVTRLIERQPERVPEFTGMLGETGKVIRAALPSRTPAKPVLAAPRRRLRVLFASWEVPSRYHGGGVYLRNLLSRLGALHDVTLVYTYGIDEVGHVEALRPYLKRIVGVPRTFLPAAYRGAGRFPLHLYDVYIPELRRVLELEVASGAYDLVDYEYSAMGPYVVPGVPSVLTVHEVGYTALLNTMFQEARAGEGILKELDRLVRSFHYFTSELPSIVNHLVTLTEEDAAAITTYSTANVYTNPSGVEVDDVPSRPAKDRSGAPILAYVGNFQHPPNQRATEYFAEQVMPRLLERYPAAEFRVYGSRINERIKELDGKNGVRVVGFVDDLRARLRGATALVAPLFTGTGQRIKVLEALGAGALVIGTDLSVRGIAAVDGEHFYRANTAEEFVQAIVRAVEHPGEAAAVARAGQELVAASHGWDAAVRQREAIWFSALGEAQAAVPLAPASRKRRASIAE